MKVMETGRITEQLGLAPGIFSLSLELPKIASAAKPGQFVMFYLNQGDALLPRPISIFDADKSAGIIRLVYHIVGRGTQHLSGLCAGEYLKVLGPLGNGFVIPQNLAGAILVGGGIGTPPLLMLARCLLAKGVECRVFLGFRQSSILSSDFDGLGCRVSISTDSGAEGFRGNAVELLRTMDIDGEIFSCGPKPMLRQLARYADERGLPCQVSLEERMACGLGGCVGCVVGTLSEQGRESGYKKICSDGPVFYSSQVVWDE